ncbi:Protein-tyrosine phosphatase-like protein [Abortiporus biennis]
MPRLASLSSLDTSSYFSSSPSSARYSAHCPAPLPPTEVIPRLYVADISAAENPSTLRALGITHVVSAMPGHVALPPELLLKPMQIPLQDNPFAELAEYLPRTTAFITDALRDPHARVLVHCVQGVSRSTSIAAAYLISACGMSPSQAVQFVKTKRSQADPNPGFISQLGEYADALRGIPPSRRR